MPAKKSEIKVSEEDEVVLDGNRISQAPKFVYYLLHKPAGYVSATEDKRDKNSDGTCSIRQKKACFRWEDWTKIRKDCF